METENIKVNQFLNTIKSSKINFISYEDDELIDSGNSDYLKQKYKNCDFDILYIEDDNGLNITIQTKY